MVTLHELVDYLNTELDIGRFRDYCPNGLQVEGRQEINTLVSGVTASMALLDAAVAAGADAILVHHGYFWKGEDYCITGMKRRRLQRLLESETSLLAYHLPLDAHPVLGNNAQLARVLGFTVSGSFGQDEGMELGQYGELERDLSGSALAEHIAQSLGRVPLHIEGAREMIHSVGWCTGAAQSYIDAAVAQGLDAFISGEISEQTVHVARECGVHYFAAGHHATERFGVQALGARLAERFDISHRFIDVENPV
ncbi:MAG: Nif3-like dinuclear metal center hexameric protein [Gammaproteobacteria bacterium]|jgi:dinuclear metal center YbgI/SA1388 family protein|nr:Nif3-like dinuclear metal center hexameric protein [Gammaproteobacteria bacterium]